MSWPQRSFVLVVAVGLFFSFLGFYLPHFLESTYSVASSENSLPVLQEVVVPTAHINTPEPLKALYMTSCVASNNNWRDRLKKLIETTELNAVVIDIKVESECTIPDLREFIEALHKSKIYVIGRISVFQDSSYTKLFPELAVKNKSDGSVWKDFKGLSFIDVGAKPYWDYIVKLSKESYELGFDEINYDYVRYPSDGNMADVSYVWTIGTSTKPEMLKSFFEYLSENMKDSGAKLSVDLFGMTTTVESDMNIGQVLENAFPYFDYISPMVYPSHYPTGWHGFANPAEYPYEVVKISMTRAIEREQFWRLSNNLATSTPSKLRPWLQDFNLGANYDSDKVRAQIKATYDTGLTSWMIWNAGNRYTEAVLLSE